MTIRRRDPLLLRACLVTIRLSARIVPMSERDAWTREWEAELRHRWAPGSRISRKGELHMLRRTFGSLLDAAWVRRQFTFDADIMQDSAHGLRLLARSPGFTLVALLVLAVGIGASTAIASLTDALLFRRLPIADAERVVTLWERNRATGVGREDVAPGNAIDWVTRSASFSAVAAIEPWSLDFTPRGGEPEVLSGARVTAGFFEVLNTPMLQGRSFAPGEFVRGKDNVVVLSYGTWKDRFGADPAIAGRALILDNQPYLAVGVLPPGIELRLFEGRTEPRFYLPKIVEDYEPKVRGSGYWNVLGRLKPGVTLEQSRDDLERLSLQLAREYPNSNRNTVAEVVPIRDHLAGSMRPLLPLLLAAAALLLVVSCANAANLLLARGLARGREFAVRQALGAARARLIRQMLAESLLLSMIGGMLGLLLADWALRAIAAIRPLDVSGTDAVGIDARVAGIAIALSIMSAIVAGLVPALQLSRPSAAMALRQGASSTAARRVRGALVVIEVCLALLLAAGAGLLIRSLHAIERVNPGFARAEVFSLQVFAYGRYDTPEKLAAFVDQAVSRMREVPGVAAAGAVSAMPFSEANINIRSSVTIDGRPAAVPGDDALIYSTVVAGDYFRAMSIPLERGRLLNAQNRAGAERVALVSRAAARKFWPAGEPIGSKIRIRFEGKVMEFKVVGIVGDARHDALDRPGRPELFLPHPQVPFAAMTFVARTHPGARVAMQSLKQQVWALDPTQAFFRTATVEELVSRTLVGRRFLVFLLSVFGAAAILLAGAGLYGVMSFSTAQRSREFGVRMALGAQPANIMSIVIGEGVRLALAGIAAGGLAAIWFTRLFTGMLFGISAADPLTFSAIAVGIVGLSVLSCYVPARRALRADPLVALRQP